MLAHELIAKIPTWYIWVSITFSLYYAIRGVVEQRVLLRLWPAGETISFLEKAIIYYMQDFLFKFIITMSSFLALFTAYLIFPTKTELTSINTSYMIFLLFLIVWGIMGICGYLTLYISAGKIPGIKGETL